MKKKKPSKTLKKAVADATLITRDTLADWLELIQKMNPLAGFVRDEWMKGLLTTNNIFDYDSTMKESSLIKVHVDFDPKTDDDDSFLTILFKDDGTGSIDYEIWGSKTEIPKYLEDTLGFTGTWEQLIRKWIKINKAIESSIPAIPTDLKE